MMKVFIPKETAPGETRVAATPESVKKLAKQGLSVLIEQGAGSAAHFTDDAYTEAGAQLVGDAAAGWGEADLVLKLHAPAAEQVAAMKAGALLIGLLSPYRNRELLPALADRKVDAIAMELVPRITRAQSMDALSSQASIAGYKAVLLAAWRLGQYFPLLMTAAGTIQPARAVVMGAGVAGLQVVATCRRLGAVVEVSDIRPAVQEEVESLGGRFIPLPESAESGEGEGGYARQVSDDFLKRQREIVSGRLKEADICITTALVPGKPAPKLVTREMAEAMKPGSVIVDMAITEGGNCDLSRADEEVVHEGVLVLAPSNLAATMSSDASTLYARNLLALLKLLLADGALTIDRDDEIVAGSLLTHGGEIVHPRFAPTLAGAEA